MSANLTAIPKLEDLLADSAKTGLLPPEAIPAILGDLERLKATLWARLTLPQGNGQAPGLEGDKLLSAKEAATKLGTSEDYLYRHSAKLPFTVRMGRQLRFSQAGMDRYIRQRTGR